MKKPRSAVRCLLVAVKYVLFVIIAIFLLGAIFLFSAYGSLKNAGLNGLAGKGALEAAVTAARSQNWEEGMRQAVAGQENFAAGLDHITDSRGNNVIRYFPPVRRQIDDLEYLLKTGEIMSRSFQAAFPIAQGLTEIRSGAGGKSFAELPAADKDEFLKYVFRSEPEINGLRANLELASLNLGKVHRIGIMWPVYGRIAEIREQLDQALNLLNLGGPLIRMLPALAGYPQESRFLLVMQNNDELRPSGGFIGVYGLLNVKGGEIRHLETDDSYHVDMPASQSEKWQVAAPEILQKQLKVEKWYLRDSNWSPDWPQSARQIEYIYNGVTGATGQPAEPFTGIIGITPDFVADLIGLVGPITIQGSTYDENNFQSLLQYNVEIAYRDQDISQWDRKEVVNELLAELKARLFSLPADKWPGLAKAIDTAIERRDIQMYFLNQSWQAAAAELGATGAVRTAEHDYLMVVDANLAAFKSDAVVKKDISYEVAEDGNGLIATLKLDYRHEGGFDWRTTRYRSYTRVYVPTGSQLVSIDGLDEATADQTSYDDKDIGKTVFGFFFSVEPGAEKQITARYRLPDKVSRSWHDGNYTLLIQRQAGRRTESLRVRFVPERGKTGDWTTDLLTDKSFWFTEGRR